MNWFINLLIVVFFVLVCYLIYELILLNYYKHRLRKLSNIFIDDLSKATGIPKEILNGTKCAEKIYMLKEGEENNDLRE
jgi:hypothetical protein